MKLTYCTKRHNPAAVTGDDDWMIVSFGTASEHRLLLYQCHVATQLLSALYQSPWYSTVRYEVFVVCCRMENKKIKNKTD